MGRYRADRSPFSALALHADTSSTTAIANDYGVQEVFARQTAAHGRPGDILLLSTSGASANLLTAAERAHGLGMTVWALTGRAPNPLHLASDEALCVDAPVSATVQELHLVAVHMLCESFDEAVEHGEADGIPPTGSANSPANGSTTGPATGSAVGPENGRPGMVGGLIGRARSVGRTPEPPPDGTRPRTAAGPANRPSGSPPGPARPAVRSGESRPDAVGSGQVSSRGGAAVVDGSAGPVNGPSGSPPGAVRPDAGAGAAQPSWDGSGAGGGAPGVYPGEGWRPDAVGGTPVSSREGTGAVDGGAGPPPGRARSGARGGVSVPRDGSRAPGQESRRAAGDGDRASGPPSGQSGGAGAAAPGVAREGDV